MLTLEQIAELQHQYEVVKSNRSDIEVRVAWDAINWILDQRDRVDEIDETESEEVSDGKPAE